MARTMLKSNKLLGCLNKSIYIGRVMPLRIEASETILKAININAQVKISKPRIMFNPGTLEARPSNTPKVVAMPLPPLNFKNIVQLCPQIQDRPKRIRETVSEIAVIPIVRILPKKKTTTNPFRTSKSNTVIPGPLPKSLRALVAPTLPDPNLRISTPFKIRPNI